MIVPQIEAVRNVFRTFQDYYIARNDKNLDAAMDLFLDSDDIEMIGIGAQQRGGNEWFQGKNQIRDIIAGDWQYWGDVRFDMDSLKITIQSDAAWLTATGKVVQTGAHADAMGQYLQQMKEMLAVPEEGEVNADSAMMEAVHYGIRRLRERAKGEGCAWPLVFSAVLIQVGCEWKFHTLHWAMPVD
jgi:hypothetical protein